MLTPTSLNQCSHFPGDPQFVKTCFVSIEVDGSMVAGPKDSTLLLLTARDKVTMALLLWHTADHVHNQCNG
jgi:hypothetical protein